MSTAKALKTVEDVANGKRVSKARAKKAATKIRKVTKRGPVNYRNTSETFREGQKVEALDGTKWTGGYEYVGPVGEQFVNIREISSKKIYRAGAKFVRSLKTASAAHKAEKHHEKHEE